MVHVMSIVMNTKLLDSYSTADRYAVFIGLRAPVSPVATILPGPSRAFHAEVIYGSRAFYATGSVPP